MAEDVAPVGAFHIAPEAELQFGPIDGWHFQLCVFRQHGVELQDHEGVAIAVTTEGLIEAGDRIPAFALPASHGRPVTPVANQFSGRPLLLVFEGSASPGAEAFGADLAALQDHQDELRAHDAVVMAKINRTSQRLREMTCQ